ncbi:hypothetical protein XELAEV_18003008mg [Xenopus laevis]|nr:hypothetical protein XELAEV_18003008mg [Xenopus laevis]
MGGFSIAPLSSPSFTRWLLPDPHYCIEPPRLVGTSAASLSGETLHPRPVRALALIGLLLLRQTRRGQCGEAQQGRGDMMLLRIPH